MWGQKVRKHNKSDSPPNYPVITPSILWGLHLSYPQKSLNSENQLQKPSNPDFSCLSHHFPMSFRWVFSVVSHGGPHLAQVVLPLCIGLQVLIPALAPSCGSGYTNCRGSRRWHADTGDISEQVFFVAVYCYHHYYFFVII